ncbi:hypothetical protein ACQ4PT_065149 [Festuca glaucescens]
MGAGAPLAKIPAPAKDGRGHRRGYSAVTQPFLFGSNFEVDYGSEEHASIVYKTLSVDTELQPDKVKREMSVSGGKLVVHFEAIEARFLRASFSAFVDLMVLVTKLVEEYGVTNEEHSAL